MYVVCHSFANVKIRHFSFPSIKPSPRQERTVGHFFFCRENQLYDKKTSNFNISKTVIMLLYFCFKYHYV